MAEHVLYEECVKRCGGMQRNEVEGVHVDGEVLISKSHKTLLNSACNVAALCGQEVICLGQIGVCHY